MDYHKKIEKLPEDIKNYLLFFIENPPASVRRKGNFDDVIDSLEGLMNMNEDRRKIFYQESSEGYESQQYDFMMLWFLERRNLRDATS